MAFTLTSSLGVFQHTNGSSPCTPHTATFNSLITFGPAVTFVSATISAGTPPPGCVPFVCPGASSTLYVVGTPTATGVFTYTIDVLLSNGGHNFYDCSHTVALVGGCPLITITPATLANVFVGQPISMALAAANGVAPYTWDVTEDTTIPAGLALSSGGVLSGAATAAGVHTFTARATDANGCPGVVAYSLTVIAPDAIVVHPATLDGGDRGFLYLALLTAENGIGAPYVFSLEAGDLPPGMALSSDGVLAGLPSAAGAYTFTVRATDGAVPTGNTGDREYTLAIAGLRIMLDGVDVTTDVDAADLELTLNRQATAHIELGDASIPARGADVLIYARDGVTPIFGGLVLVRGVSGMGASHPANKTGLECVDYSIYFDDAEVSLLYTTTQDLEDVIADIVAQSLDVYGITYTPTATGKTVPPIEWTAITVTDAFKRITDATGVVFRVLPLKELDVFTPLDDPTPVDITDATINAFDLEWRDPSNLPRNTVDLLCGPTGTGVADQEWTVAPGDTEWEVDIQAVIGDATPAHAAQAFLKTTGNFSAGETATLGSSVYTFRVSLAGSSSGDVLIGATETDSLANLIAAITNAGGAGYDNSTPVNADATAYNLSTHAMQARANVAGAAGNSIACTTTGANAGWFGEGSIPLSTLQLGSDATGAAGWTQGFVLENGAVLRSLGAPGDPDAYYTWDVTDGRGTLTIGPLGTTAPVGTVLELKYLAVYPFHARVSSGSPPITFREAHPEIVSFADGIALATQILARESADRRELEVLTDVDGFLPGQALTVNTTQRGGLVAVYLVATVRVTLVNAGIWEYSITNQQTDAYAGSYVEQWKALTSGGGSSSTSAAATVVDGGASVSGDIYSDGRTSFRADQSMGGHRLTFVEDPASAQDAATKASSDASAAAATAAAEGFATAADAALAAAIAAEHYVKRDGTVAFTGDQSLGTHKLTNVVDPGSNQDAATKKYVDDGDTAALATVAAEHYIKRDGTIAFTGDQSMGTHKITNVVDPASAQDAATKAYVDAAAPTGVILANGTIPFTGDQSMGTHKLTSVVDPASAQDAATKAYVDSVSGTAINASIYRATNQTLTHITEAALSLSNADFDTSAVWAIGSPTRLTCPTGGTGVYLVRGTIRLGAGFKGAVHLRIYKNGAFVTEQVAVGADAASDEFYQVSSVVSLIPTDYVEVKALLELAAGSGTYDAIGGTGNTFVQLARLAPQTGAVATSVLVQIAQIVTSASQATVDFTAIPAGYSSLQVHFFARDTQAGTASVVMRVRMNGDTTAANYTAASYTGVQNGVALNTTNAASTKGTFCMGIPQDGNTAGIFNQGVLEIVGYASTTLHKRSVCHGGYDDATANYSILTLSARWKSTVAINQLTFATDGTAFKNGSTFTLYGVL